MEVRVRGGFRGPLSLYGLFLKLQKWHKSSPKSQYDLFQDQRGKGSGKAEPKFQIWSFFFEAFLKDISFLKITKMLWTLHKPEYCYFNIWVNLKQGTKSNRTTLQFKIFSLECDPKILGPKKYWWWCVNLFKGVSKPRSSLIKSYHFNS